jgi:NAD+ kinase
MRIGLIVNTRRAQARAVPALVRFLTRQGVSVRAEKPVCKALRLGCEAAPEPGFTRGCDLIVALGGDGTLLRAARLIGRQDVPILGINLGELGFLTEFTLPQAQTSVAAFLKGRHQEEQRMVLEVTHRRRVWYALNDASVNMGGECRALNLRLSVNSTYVTDFVADGVVIATPTGSTAYSLAAGGPIVFPTLEAILITPLSPHALSARPLVAAPDEQIAIELGTRNRQQAALVVDGQRQADISPGEQVTFHRADFKIRLVTPRRRSYYSILRNKMKWGGR